MTENTTEQHPETPDADEAVTTAPEAAEAHDDVDGEPDSPPASKADREARLRKRAQEAESERDQLRELVTGLRRSEVERRFTGVLTNPSDVWHAAKIEDLLDESGALDTVKIETVAVTIRATHPNWAPPQRLQPNARTAGPIGQMQLGDTEDRWRGAFAPKLTH